MSDTPKADEAARNIAENVFAAYAKQANTRIHPGFEQNLLTRLVEAIRPLISNSAENLVEVANSVLTDFELTAPDVRGPRIASLNLTDKSVTAQLQPRDA